MRRWRKVKTSELRTIWSDLRAQDEWFCGCTGWALRNIYGADNVKHVAGYGWYKLI